MSVRGEKMKYNVKFSEEITHILSVEAENEEEAYQKDSDGFYDGKKIGNVKTISSETTDNSYLETEKVEG